MSTAACAILRNRCTDMNGPMCGSEIWMMRSGLGSRAFPRGCGSGWAASAGTPPMTRSISSSRARIDWTKPIAASAYGT